MKIQKEIKIGFLVIVCLGLLFWGANYLKGIDVFKKNRTFYALYDRIDGLGISNPVLLNGFKIGQVNNIDILNYETGELIVAFSINKEELNIPENTVAEIISSDILGSKAISLRLGDSEAKAIDLDTLASDVESSLSESVNQQIAPLKKKAEALISSVDSAIITVQSIFNQRARTDLESSFSSMRTSLQAFESTMNRADAFVAKESENLGLIFSHVESITRNMAQNNSKLTDLLENMEAITDSLAGANLKQTVNNASKAMKEVADMMHKVNSGEGSLGQLLNNDSLYHNLESASNDLDLLLLDMRLNPERYVHFSIFGRKDKSKK